MNRYGKKQSALTISQETCLLIIHLILRGIGRCCGSVTRFVCLHRLNRITVIRISLVREKRDFFSIVWKMRRNPYGEKSSNIGYPRIGEKRKWKKTLEKFWQGKLSEDDFSTEMEKLRLEYLKKQTDLGIDLIPVGDFSLYDHVLDTAVMFGFIPQRFQHQEKTSLQTYFDIARGNDHAIASEMTKWFNTNYHYIVPEVQEDSEPQLIENRLLTYFLEAKEKLGIIGKPVLLGPVTLLKLSKGYHEDYFPALLEKLLSDYIQVLQELESAGAEWVQIEEPVLAEIRNKDELSWSTSCMSLSKKNYPV